LYIDKVMPSAVKPLHEGEEKAVAAWQAETRRETVAQQADELAAAVKPDEKLATIAAEKGLKATTSPPFTRHPGQNSQVPTPLMDKLFAAKPGAIVTASDATGSYVAQLDEVQRPESPSQSASADLSRELDAGQRADLGEEFTQALRTRFRVEIHHQVLDKLF